MIKRDELFTELFDDFMMKNSEIEAIIVSDRQGLIIAGDKREEVDMELVSVLTSVINPVLQVIRNEFAFKKFGTASFDTEKYRLLFVSILEDAILSIVLNSMASVDKVAPYAYLIAEKVSQIETQASNDKMADQSPNDSVE